VVDRVSKRRLSMADEEMPEQDQDEERNPDEPDEKGGEGISASIRHADDIRRVEFICSNPKCREEDAQKLFPHEMPAIAIHCWHCKAGRGMSPQEMRAKGIGMFPKNPIPDLREVVPGRLQ